MWCSLGYMLNIAESSNLKYCSNMTLNFGTTHITIQFNKKKMNKKISLVGFLKVGHDTKLVRSYIEEVAMNNIVTTDFFSIIVVIEV